MFKDDDEWVPFPLLKRNECRNFVSKSEVDPCVLGRFLACPYEQPLKGSEDEIECSSPPLDSLLSPHPSLHLHPKGLLPLSFWAIAGLRKK